MKLFVILITVLFSTISFASRTLFQTVEATYVEGFVTQYFKDMARTTNFYFLKDNWGGIIKVRTSKPKPEVGKKYSITGPVNIDSDLNEVFISEESRIQIPIENNGKSQS